MKDPIISKEQDFYKEVERYFNKPKIRAPKHWYDGDMSWAKQFLKERVYVGKSIFL